MREASQGYPGLKPETLNPKGILNPNPNKKNFKDLGLGERGPKSLVSGRFCTQISKNQKPNRQTTSGKRALAMKFQLQGSSHLLLEKKGYRPHIQTCHGLGLKL